MTTRLTCPLTAVELLGDMREEIQNLQPDAEVLFDNTAERPYIKVIEGKSNLVIPITFPEHFSEEAREELIRN
jgi:uncharacterized FlaG/YvyC family protein